MTTLTSNVWLASHRYLQPVADMCTLVDAVASRLSVDSCSLPVFAHYLEDFHAGIPLLQSDRVALDVGDPSGAVRMMLAELVPLATPAAFAARCRALGDELAAHPERPPQAEAGLFRVLLWALLARRLRPVVAAFGQWRDEERWLRNYCPTCGEPPAMAQLVGRDPGRLRLLACGCCRTRWRYRRTGCPFCERPDDHRLAVVGVLGEDGLRIDYCEACAGYLKTYDGEGHEDVLLADWTSLHLDFVARDRGLKRMAASLYEV